VLRNLFVFGLIILVFGKLSGSLLIPSGWIPLFSFLGHFFFLRWRLNGFGAARR
jgi:hypothetical protein